MWIVKLTPNPNGSHDDHDADHITTVPDGWAMIPEDFAVPDTFPFVDIVAEELTYYNEVERTRKVTKTREVESFDEDGKPITVTEEYEEEETYTEQVPYTMMTVTAMTPGIVPGPVPEPPAPPTTEERLSAIEDALCEMDAANAASIAALEDALCEIDAGGASNE